MSIDITEPLSAEPCKFEAFSRLFSMPAIIGAIIGSRVFMESALMPSYEPTSLARALLFSFEPVSTPSSSLPSAILMFCGVSVISSRFERRIISRKFDESASDLKFSFALCMKIGAILETTASTSFCRQSAFLRHRVYHTAGVAQK